MTTFPLSRASARASRDHSNHFWSSARTSRRTQESINVTRPVVGVLTSVRCTLLIAQQAHELISAHSFEVRSTFHVSDESLAASLSTLGADDSQCRAILFDLEFV